MSRFIGEKQGFRGQQSFNYRANPGEFRHPLRVRITRAVAGTLPTVAQFMQPPPDGFARDSHAAPRAEFHSQRRATPSCPAPPKGGRRTLDEGKHRPLERRDAARRLAFNLGLSQPSLAAPVSRDHAVNARPRAEQEGRNLGRRASLRTQQQDMQREQVAIASSAQLLQHCGLFVGSNLKYRFSGHRRVTSSTSVGSHLPMYQKVAVCANLIRFDLEPKLSFIFHLA